jgi:phosphate-selective porin OprO and OprP
MKTNLLPAGRSIVYLVSIILTAASSGGEPPTAEKKAVPDKAEKGFADELWALPVLYKNEANPIVQEFHITGRYQGQWHETSAESGKDGGWEHRRTRLGADVTFLHDFTLEGELNIAWGPDAEGRFFEDVDTVFVKYAPNDRFYAIAGKQKVKITQEFATSNTKILTFERSLLVNQIVPDKVGGLVIGGKFGKAFIEGGIYSGDLTENWHVPEFGGGYGLSVRAGYHPTEDSEVRLDYFHQDGDADNDGFGGYDNILSLNTTNKWGRWGLNGDIMYASGFEGTPDVYGITVIPWFDISKKVRAVLRYQYASSEDPDGLSLQRRYERPAVDDGGSTRGRDYHSLYAGLNYYIYGDKLKLMTGVEYSQMGGDADYDGWTFFSGIRLYF